MLPDPKEIYANGYAALDRGDFSGAIKLATTCLNASDTDSYWYAGALGLRCWAANYAGEHERVVLDAHALLALDSGDDKMWFDGLAAFNLAIIRRGLGDVGQAELLFDQARAKYQAYRVNPKMPDDWYLVRAFFEALAHWASSGNTDKIDDLAGRLSVMPNPSIAIDQMHKAADLHQRYARGENVGDEAAKAADDGVSRTFLALLLIL